MIRTRYAVALASFLLAGGCAEQPAAPLHQHDQDIAVAGAGAPMSDLLKEVRRATARFHSTEQALKAGYRRNPHCVWTPRGGMGMHWGNMDLVDAVFDPARPEVLLYEPRPNGEPKLVGIEYVVRDVGQAHPSFDGYPFDVGGSAAIAGPHWTLHVWLYQDNPSGIFAPFNPTVSCG